MPPESQSINKVSSANTEPFLWRWFKGIVYKRHSFFHQLTSKKALNLGLSLVSYVGKKEQADYYPPMVKIDLSPLCNLHCPICVHASPKESSNLLANQYFDSSHMMSVDDFKKIIDEIKGKTLAVYLYLMGEPFMHPHLCEMARYASEAGLNVLVSSHLSFKFPDKKIADIINCGITQLEISVDGASQEVYEKTRIGGDLESVFKNIERLTRYKKEHNKSFPKIEVQCLTYDHNRHQVATLKEKMALLGVDMFTVEAGDTGSWAEMAVENFNITGNKTEKVIPSCHWPYASMTIKYNGDAISCCLFNMGKEFSKDRSQSKALGNVLKDGVNGVWNNDNYKTIWRYVSNPSLVEIEPNLKDSFCYGCPQMNSGTLKDIIVSDGETYNIRINQ